MPEPVETTAATREFLADHPEAEESLAALVERDARGDPWTFSDIALDSGQFGEIVARDLATEVSDGYRLQNPDAIRAAIEDGAAAITADDHPPADHDPKSSTTNFTTIVSSRLGTLDNIDTLTLAGLVGALLLAAVARLLAAPAVFREGFVVSPANDTYFFRYWQERLAARASGVFDLGLFADMGGAASTRPLAHAMNWWLTVLLGGVDAAPTVAAWLPVVSAVVLGYLIYRFTRLLTADVRVALAAVLFYGLAPANVVYTSVGFLDHQAHQYLWLGLLVTTLTTLGVDIARRSAQPDTDRKAAARAHAGDLRIWSIALVLAIAVAASTHAWGGSPLTFVPVATIVGLRVALDVRHDIFPIVANAPLLGGLGLGAGLALAAHLVLGWHESIAAVTPVLVAVGGVVVAGVGELWRRTDLRPLGLVAVEAVVAGGGLAVYALVQPDDIARIQMRADDLFFREGITETASLFSPDFAVVFGPLLHLGLGFYFAIVVLAAATWAVARRYEPGWLVVVCFAWYYLLLATIQVRFAGQFAIMIAPLAGVGLVYLLAAIDIARPVAIMGQSATSDSQSPRAQRADTTATEERLTSLRLPDGTRVRGYLVVTILVVLLFNLLLVPSFVGQTTHDRAQFDAALTVDAHAEDVDREYPQNFVLSQWGDNRMYNYFVSGESQGYGYAQSNHDRFLVSPHPDDWYDQFQGRVGYVVVTERDGAPPNTTYAVLYEGLGLGVNGTAAVGHYQLLASDDGVRTFTVVPGAKLRITNASSESVTATSIVTIDGTDYEYVRTTAVNDGTATVRVAYPGAYRVGGHTVTVSGQDVLVGNQTTVPPP